MALDSNFAMAWRKLGVVIANGQGLRSRFMGATQRAYALRDRLPELEQFQTSGTWLMYTSDDPSRGVALYREGLTRFPNDPTLLANGGLAMRRAGRYAEAESLASQGHAYGYAAWSNQIWAQLDQGHIAAAESTLAAFEKASPQSRSLPLLRSNLAWATGKLRLGDSVLAGTTSTLSDPALRMLGLSPLAASLTLQGRLNDARTTAAEAYRVAETRGVSTQAISIAIAQARAARRYGADPSIGLRSVARSAAGRKARCSGRKKKAPANPLYALLSDGAISTARRAAVSARPGGSGLTLNPCRYSSEYKKDSIAQQPPWFGETRTARSGILRGVHGTPSA